MVELVLAEALHLVSLSVGLIHAGSCRGASAAEIPWPGIPTEPLKPAVRVGAMHLGQSLGLSSGVSTVCRQLDPASSIWKGKKYKRGGSETPSI